MHITSPLRFLDITGIPLLLWILICIIWDLSSKLPYLKPELKKTCVLQVLLLYNICIASLSGINKE